jgi:hypothetical protein
MCRRVSLGYADPRTIRLEDYKGRGDEGILFVEHAGEVLHRLESERPARIIHEGHVNNPGLPDR